MKAVLVIDMPRDMRIEETKALYITLFNGMIAREYTLDCPLRPLPEMKDADILAEFTVSRIFNTGWNACIKAIITGETK